MKALHLALGAAGLATAAIAAPPAWVGTYTYEEAIGRSLSGVAPFVNHKLVLTATGCTLSAEGYQTNETLRCTATPKGNALDIKFVSYPDGKTKNVYGVEMYKPGSTLLTLSRSGGAVTTTFGTYNREAKVRSGKLFKKA